MATNLDISIKMFRLGELGDSFLISFLKDSKDSHILIDFGSFRNSAKSITRLRKLAKEILKLCNGKIDVVVGTHQHNDHVSGFHHCSDLFKNKIEQVWLSWLDNPKNKFAESLGKEHKDLQSMIFKISDELDKAFKGSRNFNSAISKNVNDILGFYGAKTPEIPFQGINILKELGKKKIKYLVPGQTEQINEITKDDVKVYVLGPPIDKAKLYDIKPDSSETYDPHLTNALNSSNNLYGALLNYNKQESKDEENYPFNKTFKIKENELKKSKLNFTGVDVNNTKDLIKLYRDISYKWKTIDHDWLEQASRLALYLDTYTNNSSLVLAIEIVKSGKVLLFAADAQTGNWLSWFDLKFENDQLTIEYLLANTVFYKVGHHGSHNATLVKGLELMTHDDLIAMIPVDKTDSNISKANGWKMPAKNLYKQLIKQTKNRVLLMDDIFGLNCDPKKEPAKSSWKKSKSIIKSNDSYIELLIDG